MFVSWLIFPVVATVILLGLGLLVDRAAGTKLPGVLLFPLGLAALVVVTQFTTLFGQSWPVSVPVVVILVALGIALGYRRIPLRKLDSFGVLVAASVFLLSGAVVFLSGEATFAGYGVLGDTSVHMIGADYLVHHGHAFSEPAPSAYLRVLLDYFEIHGYPSGLHTAMGTLSATVGADVAWIYQPFLSVLLGLLALSFYSLARGVRADCRWAAVIAISASMPSILFGFYLQGSLKEVGFVALLAALGAVSIGISSCGRLSYRSAIPSVVIMAACVATVGLAAVVWLGPLLVIAAAFLLASRRVSISLKWPDIARVVGVVLGVVLAVVVLAIPSLKQLSSYLGGTKFLVQQTEFGNLTHGAISPLEMFGTWLSDDYRDPPGISYTATNLLVALAVALAVFALFGLIRERKISLLGFIGICAIATGVVVLKGSPWADAKAYAIAAPFVVLLAGLGCLYITRTWNEQIGAIAITVLVAGIGLSDLFQAREAKLAPRAKFNELTSLDRRLDGSQATFVGGFDEFSKYFLRNSAPDTVNDWSFRVAPTVDGAKTVFGESLPLEKLQPGYLTQFEALVLPKGTTQPDPAFALTNSGRYYDLWQKQDR